MQPDPTAHVYALPDPPADLTVKLRDREGRLWRHYRDGEWRLVGGFGGAAVWWGLVSHYGPLTEVTDDHA